MRARPDQNSPPPSGHNRKRTKHRFCVRALRWLRVVERAIYLICRFLHAVNRDHVGQPATSFRHSIGTRVAKFLQGTLRKTRRH
ncbi:JM156 [macacine gammaherpesvirus 11]|uniref:JM156 n=2 Tax=macacine gammaherpesvirus 11 TaxID=2560570 RepID=G9JMG3_9GAMA|nr:JM156 [Macaca fuscata rhadinovirus]AAT00133.1 JM156 [Macaca fuscata rhadinovirus]AEW87680.1 JM156 [Macaca fuscata rhadinovirus]AEW87850.1 JM156 [Macaca fuscata rhadinovirus]